MYAESRKRALFDPIFHYFVIVQNFQYFACTFSSMSASATMQKNGTLNKPIFCTSAVSVHSLTLSPILVPGSEIHTFCVRHSSQRVPMKSSKDHFFKVVEMIGDKNLHLRCFVLLIYC